MSDSTTPADLFSIINLVFTLGCLSILVLIYKQNENRAEPKEEKSIKTEACEEEACDELDDKNEACDDEPCEEEAEEEACNDEADDDEACEAKHEDETHDEEPTDFAAYYSDKLRLDAEWLTKRSGMLFGRWASEYTRSLEDLNRKYNK